MYIRKVFCPEAGLSLTCTTRVVHISVYQTKERSEVVCQVHSSPSQWPYGNTFHSTHKHKSAANTTTKHSHTPNSSQTVKVINETEPSWVLQASRQMLHYRIHHTQPHANLACGLPLFLLPPVLPLKPFFGKSFIRHLQTCINHFNYCHQF